MTANLPPTRESRPLSTADLMDAIKLVAYRMHLLRRINKGVPMTWAQRCGCTCRCSPGFFISHTEWDYTSYRFYGFGTIWFEIKKVTVLGKELQPANTETLLAIATA